MSKHNVVIVGNGLFGSIAATLARAHGHNVTVISNSEPMAGSGASGCVLAPSWVSSLGKEAVGGAMGVLEELYTVHPMSFSTNALVKFKASRVDPGQVLVKPDVSGSVERVANGKVVMKSGEVYSGRVLVAAGFWSQGLVQMPVIRGLFGASLRVKAQLPNPMINVYAPYRQAVAFNISKSEVWVGDGTALVQKTWDKESEQRKQATVERACELFGLSANPRNTRAAVGIRPYVEGHKGGYFERVSPSTWVSTGGAKNGTVLAAWQALRFVKEALK